MADWFQQNAPKTTATGGDWFSRNAPKPSADQVGATMRAKYPQAFATPNAPQSWLDVAENVTINDILGAPIKGAIDTAKALVTHPIDTVKGMVTGPISQAKQAYDAARQGNIPEALARTANAVPFIGSIGESADINHPGAVIGNAALAALTATPSGRALAGEAGAAVKDAAAPTVATVKGAVKAGGKDLAVGASKVAGGAIVDALGAPYHVGTLYGIKEGIGDIARGAKAAIQGGKDSLARFRELQSQAQAARSAGHPIAAPVQTPNPLAVQQPLRPAPQNEVPLTPAPSGGMPAPGGIQNQKAPPAEISGTITSAPDAAVVVDPSGIPVKLLDEVATGGLFGKRKSFSMLTDTEKATARKTAQGIIDAATREQGAAKVAPVSEHVRSIDPNKIELRETGQKAQDIASLEAEIGNKGIHTPIMAYEDWNGGVHVIDGHHRVLAARNKGIDVPTITIPESKYKQLRVAGYEDTQIKTAYAREVAGVKAKATPVDASAPVNTAMADALTKARGGEGRRTYDPNYYGDVRPANELRPWDDQAAGAQRTSPHELKATRAADLAGSNGITAEQVASFTDSQKAQFTEALKAKYPAKWKSGLDLSKTWDDIVDTLKQRGTANDKFKAAQKQASDAVKSKLETSTNAENLQDAINLTDKSSRPVANPQLLGADQITAQIERLSKKPNLKVGETNLLRQLRDEVGKRGSANVASKQEPWQGMAYGSEYYKEGGKWFEKAHKRDPRHASSGGEWQQVGADDAKIIERMVESGRIAPPGAPWPPVKK